MQSPLAWTVEMPSHWGQGRRQLQPPQHSEAPLFSLAVYPALPEALRRKWDDVEQSLYEEMITKQVYSYFLDEFLHSVKT